MRQIKYIFVHCTASTQEATPESLLRYFRQVKGWRNPGYHYVVDSRGHITPLLSEEQVANGVLGYNSESIHVAWIGGTDRRGRAIDNRTEEQKAALRDLVGALHEKYPSSCVLGHRDISPDANHNGIVDAWERIKECPCFDVRTEL